MQSCVHRVWLQAEGIGAPSKLSSINSPDYVFTVLVSTVEPPTTDPPMSGQPLYDGHWLWHQIEITTKLVFNQPPTSGCFLVNRF